MSAEKDAGHRQVHRPHDGASECTCGEWVGPMTTLPATDPRSFGYHLDSVTAPAEHDHDKCCRYLHCAHPTCCGYYGETRPTSPAKTDAAS